ncbi:hypothetical protein ACFX2J_004090 [Malus domestica]
MSSSSSITIGGENAVHANVILLPSVKFNLTDELLVSYYLRSKIQGTSSLFRHTIPEIDATDQGFYKITGKEREIRAEESKAVIGKKRILTFYEGRVLKEKKTDWVVHEYYLIKIEVGSRPTKQMASRTGMSSGSSSAAPALEKEPMPPASATSSASLTLPPVISSATS